MSKEETGSTASFQQPFSINDFSAVIVYFEKISYSATATLPKYIFSECILGQSHYAYDSMVI